MSEDCLFINVWAPADATPDSKLPVWFYIQGGGYITNSNANYNGTKVIEESGGTIIFVNFNYRVSAYGFLASQRLRKDGSLNSGLLDQRKALEWVQMYIHLFGGDPRNVVVHGTSAGAGSLALHLSAYGGRDDKLFSGGIGQSAFLPILLQVSDLEFQFDRFVQGAGCNGALDELACLRSRETWVLQSANRASAYPGAAGPPKFYFTPCIDGEFIQDHLILLFEEGKFVRVPVMFGNDNDEGTLMVANSESPEDVATFMANQFPRLTKAHTDAINDMYPLMVPLPQHAPYFPSVSAAYGEGAFVCPSIAILQSFVRYLDPNKIWSYRVNIQQKSNINGGLGTPHTFETPAIFGLGYAGSPGSFLTYNSLIVPVIMNYWISFVKDLNPNRYRSPTAPRWEPYAITQTRIILQTNATAMENIPDEQLARCEFWKALAITLQM